VRVFSIKGKFIFERKDTYKNCLFMLLLENEPVFYKVELIIIYIIL